MRGNVLQASVGGTAEHRVGKAGRHPWRVPWPKRGGAYDGVAEAASPSQKVCFLTVVIRIAGLRREKAD